MDRDFISSTPLRSFGCFASASGWPQDAQPATHRWSTEATAGVGVRDQWTAPDDQREPRQIMIDGIFSASTPYPAAGPAGRAGPSRVRELAMSPWKPPISRGEVSRMASVKRRRAGSWQHTIASQRPTSQRRGAAALATCLTSGSLLESPGPPAAADRQTRCVSWKHAGGSCCFCMAGSAASFLATPGPGP
jgi:hypothetical protein